MDRVGFPYRGAMTEATTDSFSRRTAVIGWVYSLVVLSIGLVVSLATGEWLALLCAAGLVIVPVGGAFARSRRARG